MAAEAPEQGRPAGCVPIVHVVGARPQFVKVAALLRAARTPERHVLLHTGQHFDPGLSEVFFRDLGIPPPHLNLGIGGGTHGEQTGRMLEAVEKALLGLPRGWLVVYGDTNSTLAAALAGAKLGWPIAHVEAGLRAFDRQMPEEINRIVADHLAAMLLCPTPSAADQLTREGITAGARWSGDVMLDVARQEARRAAETPLGRFLAGEARVEVPEPFASHPALRGGYFLATIHRAANTDEPATLRRIVDALGNLGRPVLWPVHPRTRGALERANLRPPPGLVLTPPFAYLDFAALLQGAEAVLTDSGGVQKEAFFAGRRCVTLRDRTEWGETLKDGWNTLAGDDPATLSRAVAAPAPTAPPDLSPFGDGQAGARCAAWLEGEEPALPAPP